MTDNATNLVIITLLLLVILSFVFNFLLMVYLFLFYVIGPLFFGAFYAKTKQDIVESMMRLSNIKPGEKAVDLGSGDGSLVIALAKKGAMAHGYEVSPFLVWISKRNIKKAGLQGKAFIYLKSFWPVDLSQFDIVTVYGITYIMNRLEKKLQKELKLGARVVSNHFEFPTWKCYKKDGQARLYIK